MCFVPPTATDRSPASAKAGRAATTRAALLDAAREVFATSGFADASIADVVSQAGASVGSLYHHFGGKADLYLALFEQHAARQEHRSAEAVRAAQSAGETDRVALFVAGARAYLDGCWRERDLARVFLAGGGPSGFELVARGRYREWTRQNAILLAADERELFGEALVLVLTTVTQQAGAEVAVCETEERARELSEEVLALIARIGRPPG